MAGIGGGLVAMALSVVAIDRWLTYGALAGPRLAIGAVLAVSVLLLAQPDDSLRPAAVAASGVGVIPFFFVMAAGDGFPSFTAVAAMSGVALALLYLVGPAPGHTFHLVILAAAAWVAALSAGGTGVGEALFGGFDTLDDLLAGAGAASLIVGTSLLAAGWWLDHRGLAGMATPLLGVGSLAAGVGAFVIRRDLGEVAGALLAASVAVAVVMAGRPGRRRGSLWAGLALAAAGAVLLARGLVPGDDLVAEAATVAALGMALVGLAAVRSRRT